MAIPQFQIEKGDRFWTLSIEDRNYPWMTPSQVRELCSTRYVIVYPAYETHFFAPQVWTTALYGWIAAGVIATFAVTVMYQLVYQNILSLLTNTYEVS